MWAAIGRRQWELCRRNEEQALAGDVEALHDLRVALRRLRVWLKITALMRGEDTTALEDELRRTQKILGPARDADIAGAFVRHGRVQKPQYERACRALAEALMRRGQRGRRAARTRLRSPKWRNASLAVERLLGEISEHASFPEELLQRVGRAAIRRAAKKVRRRYEGLGAASSRKLHRLRIAVRKLRYISEFFSPFLGQEARTTARAAKKVQDVLGDIHDVDIVLALLREHAESSVLGITDFLHARRRRLMGRFGRVWGKAQSNLV